MANNPIARLYLISDNIKSILGRQLSGSWSHLRNLRIIRKFRRIDWQRLYIRNAGCLKTCVFGIESRNSWQTDHAIFFEIFDINVEKCFKYNSIPIRGNWYSYVWRYRIPSQYSTIPNTIYQEHQIVLWEAGATRAYKGPLRHNEEPISRNFELLIAAK